MHIWTKVVHFPILSSICASFYHCTNALRSRAVVKICIVCKTRLMNTTYNSSYAWNVSENLRKTNRHQTHPSLTMVKHPLSIRNFNISIFLFSCLNIFLRFQGHLKKGMTKSLQHFIILAWPLQRLAINSKITRVYMLIAVDTCRKLAFVI